MSKELCRWCSKPAGWLLNDETPICSFCRWTSTHHDRKLARMEWTRIKKLPSDVVAFRLPRPYREALEAMADRENKTVGTCVRELIMEAVKGDI